ncbi:poly(A) RNA polymerase GLD2-like [Diadema antillarum]|uniref:poly(A) RNA polymerase GLD2-like n=1 Tax=Diadema antillarum TaxID=105358 RepID=UPI003A882831
MAQDSRSQEMMQYYNREKLQAPGLDMIVSAKKSLGNVIRNDLYSNAKLLVFGSAVSGFGAAGCDADLTLWFPDSSHDEYSDKARAVEILRRLERHLKGMGPSSPIVVTDVTLVPATTTVPILKMRHVRHDPEIDLNIDVTGGVLDSCLQKLYVEEDGRVGPLGFIVKQWAKRNGICNPREGTLNSISWVLMTINYMQAAGHLNVVFEAPGHIGWHNLSSHVNIAQVEEYLLDRRHLHVFNRRVNGQLFGPSSLGDLLQGFFAYYADFNFENTKIAVRTGSAPRRQMSMEKIYIEGPEKGTNTASAVTVSGFNKIRDKLRRARNILSRNESWMNIMAP